MYLLRQRVENNARVFVVGRFAPRCLRKELPAIRADGWDLGGPPTKEGPPTERSLRGGICNCKRANWRLLSNLPTGEQCSLTVPDSLIENRTGASTMGDNGLAIGK